MDESQEQTGRSQVTGSTVGPADRSGQPRAHQEQRSRGSTVGPADRKLAGNFNLKIEAGGREGCPPPDRVRAKGSCPG